MLRTSDLDYELPPDRVATEPSRPRDAARLMVVDRGDPSRAADLRVSDLPGVLRPGDLLVFNTTRVLPARLRGVRAGTGGRIDGLYLSDAAGGAAGERRWNAFLKGRHLRATAVVDVRDREGQSSGIRLVILDRSADEPGAWLVRVEGEEGLSSAEVLERVGWTPLPPYILAARKHGGSGGDERADRQEYQTVYAREDQAASVAAPTAGLHFTPELLSRLAAAGIGRADVTLHVGSGTFKPVETDFVEQHPMHAEWCSMSRETVEAIRWTRAAGGRVIPAGTTAARTIESYAAVVERGEEPPPWLQTRLLITPGYRFLWMDGLMTNFHLPRSTLLALVGAVLDVQGDGLARVKSLYERAVGAGYRFYSFGDAMLVV